MVLLLSRRPRGWWSRSSTRQLRRRAGPSPLELADSARAERRCLPARRRLPPPARSVCVLPEDGLRPIFGRSVHRTSGPRVRGRPPCTLAHGVRRCERPPCTGPSTLRTVGGTLSVGSFRVRGRPRPRSSGLARTSGGPRARGLSWRSGPLRVRRVRSSCDTGRPRELHGHPGASHHSSCNTGPWSGAAQGQEEHHGPRHPRAATAPVPPRGEAGPGADTLPPCPPSPPTR